MVLCADWMDKNSENFFISGMLVLWKWWWFGKQNGDELFLKFFVGGYNIILNTEEYLNHT